MSEIKRVTIGRIGRVRGVKGEMVVIPLTDDPDRFFGLKNIMISKRESTREFHIEGARKLAGRILLKLQEIQTPEEAKYLVGGFVEIEKENLIKLSEGSYFVFDLIGLEVITAQGVKIGRVNEVISLPANDIYVVKGEAKQYDIPATKEVVKKIDLKKRELIIEPIAGLLEI